MRIGVDAMGGDFAPESVVKGAVMALDALGAEHSIVLYGEQSRIEALLAEQGCSSDRISIVHTEEVIAMSDHPVRAFTQKSRSSITVGFRNLSAGKIDGFASAGSTGAMMVGSTQVIRVIEGVMRPTIATTVTTTTGQPVMLLDIGLNVDCRPDVLDQYGLIGSIYANSALGIERPRVALLNIGEEASKGTLQARAAHEHMQVSAESGKYHFVGNVEASHIFTSDVADVVVCDGFVGNVLLKLTEGFYSINRSLGIEHPFWNGMNYENTGGTPVLGINAPVVIGHGKSTPLAIKSMILTTAHAIETGLINKLQEAFSK